MRITMVFFSGITDIGKEDDPKTIWLEHRMGNFKETYDGEWMDLWDKFYNHQLPTKKQTLNPKILHLVQGFVRRDHVESMIKQGPPSKNLKSVENHYDKILVLKRDGLYYVHNGAHRVIWHQFYKELVEVNVAEV